MARELEPNEAELYNYIMETVVGNQITLEGFETIVALVKKEFKKKIIL